jgi:IclR family transcriptional regulator, acetate operon repressor
MIRTSNNDVLSSEYDVLQLTCENGKGIMDVPTEKPRVNSALRTLQILLACAKSENGLLAKEIAERVNTSRQVTYHLLHTLRGAGFVERGPDQRYQLGLSVGTLVEAFERQLAPPARLMSHVQALSSATGEACSVVGWHSGEPVILAFVPGKHAVRVSDIHTGQSGNAHARASGKLLLAFASAETRDEYLDGRALVPLTPNTLTSRSALDEDLRLIRSQGFALDREEFAEGICCIAALAHIGTMHFAFSVSAPTWRFREMEAEYVEAVRSEAEAASTHG